MKNQFVLSFLIIVLGIGIASCGDTSDNTQEKVNEEVVKDQIDLRFQKCYYEDDYARKKCDSLLISSFGEVIFNRNIRFDPANSFLNCEVDGKSVLVPFGDTNHCIANTFDLVYSINQNGGEIYSFRMVAGNEMEFEAVSTIVNDQFFGYRQLLEGKLAITYAEAKRIALENGVNLEESDLELVINETEALGKSNYHWEAELNYENNSLILLQIDVMTGEINKEVLNFASSPPIN